jgi:N-carbamoyl-L-amino-acid hydrolase
VTEAPGLAGFDALWTALEPIGRDDRSGGYRRFAWTAEDAALREWFAGEATTRGLDLTEDRAGNQWAWWGDPDADGPGVVIGSHLDSVPDGGAFDGPLGVVSSLAALDALRDRGFRPAKPIAVVNFGDEEGARFGIACAGSRILTGALDPDRARSLTDRDSTTLAEAMRAAGRCPDDLGADPDTVRRIGAFVELHVEQGRGLIDLGRPVAVGTAIRPHGRWRIDLRGEANHAGTTPMSDRSDAMVAAASVVLEAEATATRNDGVATCGKLEVVPNGVNAIPSHVRVWLDVRAESSDQVESILSDLREFVEWHGGTMTNESWTDVTRFDPHLAHDLSTLLGDAPLLDTGAGHDAGVLASAGVPAAMLFVRNPTGVSHSPAEFAERDDCHAGVVALTRVVEQLAG